MCAAPPDKVTPFATPAALECYDGFLFGVPTRFGTFPQQWTAFLDSARPQWQSHAFAGKLVGAFVACGKSGSGTEATVINMVPTFVHFGLTFVPAGSIYNDLLHHEGGGERGFGASPWGAGTLSVSFTLAQRGKIWCPITACFHCDSFYVRTNANPNTEIGFPWESLAGGAADSGEARQAVLHGVR